MPLFVRSGSIIPMLLNDVQTLCDANYVNNAAISTPDNGLLLLIYPAATSQFSVYDGTVIQCNAGAGEVTVTLTSVPRSVMLQILADEPAKVSRDGATVPRFATSAQFDAVDIGWRFDPQRKLVFVKFPHVGGTTNVKF